MVLVGPSGSGKTTMIKMINRLLEPTDGNIYGRRNASRTTYMNGSYVCLQVMSLQAIALFPKLTVAENIASFLRWRAGTKERVASKQWTFEKSWPSCFSMLIANPSELSGGGATTDWYCASHHCRAKDSIDGRPFFQPWMPFPANSWLSPKTCTRSSAWPLSLLHTIPMRPWK